MRTRSSSNLPVVSSNLSTLNPKRRNRRRSKQPFILEESPMDTMADQRTMAELLRVPTEGAARQWLEKEPPRFIHTWEDLVSKFINEFFPPSRTTNLRNEISNFQQRFDGSFHEAWDRYKDLLPDQDSLNAAAGGNLLERRTQDVLTIIKNKSKGNFVYRPPGMANQIRPPGFAQPNVQNNQNRFGQPQGFNRDNNFNPKQSYQAPIHPNQIVPLNELEKVKRMNEANMKAMQTQINIVKNELRNEMKNSIQASLSNQINEIKNMMASLFQINTASTSGSGSLPSNTVANPKGKLKAITTRSGIVLDGPTIPTPPPFINPKDDERVEETLTDPHLSEYTIKVPHPPVQKYKPPSQREYLHINITLADALILMPKYQKMLKALISNKEKLQELENTPLNENCSAVILKKLPKKLGDPGKFLIPCGFSLPELISTRMTLELANRAICTPARIARDVFVSVGKFTFPADFIIVDYESNPRVPLILGIPFLRTAHALIDVHREEMILRDGDERLTLNMIHDTSSYSNQPQKESINLINVFNNSSEDFLKDLFSNQPSGNPTFSSHPDLTSSEVNYDT
nr:hypothetical protein [Tanacetum cinerariifolium]